MDTGREVEERATPKVGEVEGTKATFNHESKKVGVGGEAIGQLLLLGFYTVRDSGTTHWASKERAAILPRPKQPERRQWTSSYKDK